MATRRIRRQAGGRSNRKFVWAREGVHAIVNAESELNLDLLEDFKTVYGADLLGATVMRIRGRILVSPPTFQDISATTIGMGIRIYTEGPDALAQVPGVASQPHADWMAIQHWPLADQSFGSTWGLAREELDVKSNRKLEELGQGLMISFANPTVGVAYHVDAVLSIGIKLP